MRVLITGDHDGLPKALTVRGESVEWIEWRVLRFEALAVSPDVKARVFSSPPDWIIFTSPRGVEFWKQALEGLPGRSRLAAIGPTTAQALGPAVTFQPRQAGSEGFLAEFNPDGGLAGLRVLIAGAEQGRRLIPEQLEARGAKVERLALYRTSPQDKRDPIPHGIDALILTSPSSVESALSQGPLPSGLRLVSMGKYTSESLKRHGLVNFREVPGGDLARVGEVL